MHTPVQADFNDRVRVYQREGSQPFNFLFGLLSLHYFSLQVRFGSSHGFEVGGHPIKGPGQIADLVIPFFFNDIVKITRPDHGRTGLEGVQGFKGAPEVLDIIGEEKNTEKGEQYKQEKGPYLPQPIHFIV